MGRYNAGAPLSVMPGLVPGIYVLETTAEH
jgi:hypothetical protein